VNRHLAAGPAALVALFAAGCCLCPRVYRVDAPRPENRPSPPQGSFGVLFLPSGFERTDLPAFRTATHEMANELLLEPPFGPSDAGGLVEFYRIDLVGNHPRRACRLEHKTRLLRAPSSLHRMPVGTPLDTIRHRPSSLSLDLRAKLSGCEELSIDFLGEEAALALARCVPGVDAVVVVVNLDRNLGMVRQVGGTNDIAFALISVDLPDIHDASVGSDGYVESTASETLGHELAHILGLLDEYYCDATDPICRDMEWPQEPSFRPGRNVWQERPPDSMFCSGESWIRGESMASMPGCCGTTGNCSIFGPSALPGGIPWIGDESVSSILKCCGTTGNSSIFVTEQCCESELGLWEGAFYRQHGYFRSEQFCRMAEPSRPFCAFCRGHIAEAVRAHSGSVSGTSQQSSP